MAKSSPSRILTFITKYRVLLTISVGILALMLIDSRPLWPGMLVALFGEAIQLWAASHLHKNKSLATSGPYAHVRNPMYFGRFFVGLGIILMIGNIWVTAVYLLYYLVYVTKRVAGEEARLEQIFGEDYAKYKAEVHRFRPQLRSYSGSAAVQAQWSGVLRNHEYRNAVGLVVYFALLCLRVEYLPPDILTWI